MKLIGSARSFGLLTAFMLSGPSLLGGCDQVPGGSARTPPTAELSQAVPGVDAQSARLQVVRRSYGSGYAMFELNRAVDPALLDLAKTRLMTVRPGADGKLAVIEAAGDVFLDATGRVLSIEVADTPAAGEVYRAVTVADVAAPGAAAEELDLGDVVVRERPDEGADLAHAMYVAPRLMAGTVGAVKEPITTNALQLLSSEPADGTTDVDRDIYRVLIKYRGATIDCAHPITGKDGFHLYSVDPALQANRQQEMYPDMPVGYGNAPTFECDASRNQISMLLPGPLLGGTVFKVETKAKATDGTTLSAITTFRTKNPGLFVWVSNIKNEIYECDTHYPWSGSYRCDVYLVTQGRTRVAPGEQGAWQINGKFPPASDWGNWPEDLTRTFLREPRADGSGETVTLYKDALPVGDPVAIEVQSFDTDDGDGVKKALAFIGGVGKIVSPWYPPAGPVGEGATILSNIIPHDEDDFLGGGVFYLPKSTRWGTINPKHTWKLAGREANSQIVLDMWVEEYPAPWFAPAIIQ